MKTDTLLSDYSKEARNKEIVAFGEKLKPLYKELISKFHNINDYYLFCAQWGNDYPIGKPHDGILFYGRSVNSWIDSSYDVNEIFAPPYDDIFNRDDQLKWMEGYARSPFVNLVRRISKAYYPNNWRQHIAWSNVCKVSPEKGNPDENVWDTQYFSMVKIMDAELEFFSPKLVVFITGVNAGDTWHAPLLETNYCKGIKFDEKVVWGNDRYDHDLTTKAGTMHDTLFIITERPEFRPIADEEEAINKIIRKFSHDIKLNK